MTSSTDETTVFIDTNLNTHLAFIVPDSVTVSDLKRIIVSEHHQCFPAIGNIKIDGLKVIFFLQSWIQNVLECSVGGFGFEGKTERKLLSLV
ncbi:E3 ubiquitin protein ligase RBBP6 [Tanacetum coccineum]